MLYCYYTALLVSFLASCSLYKQKNVVHWLKLFCPFLGITIIVEGYAFYLSYHNHTNLWLYHIFAFIEFCFYLYVVSCIIHNLKARLLIKYILILYVCVAIIDIIITPNNSFVTFAYTLGTLLIIVCCVYYFFELFHYPKPKNLAREPSFWICLGLLVFYCGTLPYFGMMTFISAVSQRVVKALWVLLDIANIMMYTFFIIAFLCQLKTPKYTSQ